MYKKRNTHPEFAGKNVLKTCAVFKTFINYSTRYEPEH